MKEGAFAFLDCLGFKGVWDRGVEANQIIGFLEEAKARSHELPTAGLVKQFVPVVEQSISFVSDTIAISTCAKQPDAAPTPAGKGYLVLLTVQVTIEICRRFATAPVPLAIRGAITFGPHIAKDSFLLGPAVDEAAVLAETTQGAFVWLNPRAQSFFWQYMDYYRLEMREQFARLPDLQRVKAAEHLFSILSKYSPTLSPAEVASMVAWWGRLNADQKGRAANVVLVKATERWRDDNVLRQYPMQMKSGGELCADVVNPLFLVPIENHEAWILHVLSSFDDAPVDVLMKKQNTARFLYLASHLTRKAVAATAEQFTKAQKELAILTGVQF
jgi:hypothetical protein